MGKAILGLMHAMSIFINLLCNTPAHAASYDKCQVTEQPLDIRPRSSGEAFSYKFYYLAVECRYGSGDFFFVKKFNKNKYSFGGEPTESAVNSNNKILVRAWTLCKKMAPCNELQRIDHELYGKRVRESLLNGGVAESELPYWF